MDDYISVSQKKKLLILIFHAFNVSILWCFCNLTPVIVEAVVCKCSSKYVFFKIWQISPLLESFLTKVAGLERLFYRTPPVTASGYCHSHLKSSLTSLNANGLRGRGHR